MVVLQKTLKALCVGGGMPRSLRGLSRQSAYAIKTPIREFFK